MKNIISKLWHPIGSSYSMYIDECACTTKTSNLSDGLCREISSNLSYDNSFFKERSSAVGRGDGPV